MGLFVVISLRKTIGTGLTFASVKWQLGSLIHRPFQGVPMRPVSKVVVAVAVSPASSVAFRRTL